MDADFGVMVSASHNPAPDNGIKIFARGGVKLPDVVEQRIEAALTAPKLQPTGGGVGRIRRFADAEDRYVVHLLGSLPHRLDGLHVVLDCAHGAASGVSPETFRDAGARVTVIGADPDGLNINDGVGSTHLGPLAVAVLRPGGRRHRARRRRGPLPGGGSTGRVVDGDQIMAILAVAMKNRGHLVDDTLVATVMSNLGLHVAMAEQGIACCRPRGRPLRAGVDERGRLLPRRRAVRPRHHQRVRHHRRRPPHRPAPDGRDGATGQEPGRAASVMTVSRRSSST